MVKQGLIILFLSVVTLFSKAENGGEEVEDSLCIPEIGYSKYVEDLHASIADSTLKIKALDYALRGFHYLKAKGKLKDSTMLTVVDFSMSGNDKRMFLIDLDSMKLVRKSLCAHGVNSGSLYPRKFSNIHESRQSSLGFYVTGKAWNDRRLKYCLRLSGQESCNDKAQSRGIIIHAADYATQEFIDKYGTLGRSYGCPAIPWDDYEALINTIKEGTCFYIYYPDRRYLKYSKMINRSLYLDDFAKSHGLLETKSL